MSVYSTVDEVMQKYGIPSYIWFPIMQEESGGNPDAQNSNAIENSIGLFQINTKANPGYAASNLTDPATNAEIAARDFLSGTYKYAVALYPNNAAEQTAYTWKNGIKPAWTTNLYNSIVAATNKFIAGGSVLPDGTAPAATDTASSVKTTQADPIPAWVPDWMRNTYAKMIIGNGKTAADVFVTGNGKTVQDVAGDAASSISSWVQPLALQGFKIIIGLAVLGLGAYLLFKNQPEGGQAVNE